VLEIVNTCFQFFIVYFNIPNIQKETRVESVLATFKYGYKLQHVCELQIIIMVFSATFYIIITSLNHLFIPMPLDNYNKVRKCRPCSNLLYESTTQQAVFQEPHTNFPTAHHTFMIWYIFYYLFFPANKFV